MVQRVHLSENDLVLNCNNHHRNQHDVTMEMPVPIPGVERQQKVDRSHDNQMMKYVYSGSHKSLLFHKSLRYTRLHERVPFTRRDLFERTHYNNGIDQNV